MSDSSPDQKVNRLAQETSAYLRQHMHNPVDWYPWGAEALERAEREDLPLLVSIGYSACHWCHVMERESFEDPETAAVMNRLFVNVKVDREEHPDVDSIYMDTVVRLTGHGGWPLTVFCTPDGRPFHAGTYFPPEPRHGMPAFRQVLESVARAYREQPDAVRETTLRILAALRAEPRGVADEAPGRDTVKNAAAGLMQNADDVHGGFGNGPKFPNATSLDLLLSALDVLHGAARENVREHLIQTCRLMARRGLWDHLGGGFHRYCVDGRWLIPHFEKMLYDQGQLLRTYAELWRRTGCEDDDLVWPVRETVDYLRREMTGPEGAFYASQDADSEGEEGKFYVWTPEQVEAVLGEEARDFCDAYGVTASGNFEHGTTHLSDFSRSPRASFSGERERLRVARGERVPPATDTKRVASWNGWTVSGLARAGSLLGDDAIVADGARAAAFVLDHMRDDQGRLLRVFAEDRAHVLAFLDDVAGMLEACLDLFRAGAGGRWLSEAVRLANDVAERFFDPREGDLFLTPMDGERLIHRPGLDQDGATPSAVGLAVLGLLRTAQLTGRPELSRVASEVLRKHALMLEHAPHAFTSLARAGMLAEQGGGAAVIVGAADDPETAALALRARRVLGPEEAVLVVAPGETLHEELDPSWLRDRPAVDGRPTAYVCRGTTCSLPVHDPEALVPLPLD